MRPSLLGPHDRRDFLRLATAAGVSWLTPLSFLLARDAEKGGKKEPPQSVILLWLQGGPSQLETFDPHPGADIAGGTEAISTSVKGVQFAANLPRIAEQMDSLAVIRSVMSKEGDHERGTYMMKTGYRPDPTVVHPSIGAICCHELPVGKTDIPRHISILPNQFASRGGHLGDEYDAFKCYDPAQKIPDLASRAEDRDRQRLKDLDVVEKAFAKGRQNRTEATLHRDTIDRARTMMTSEQLKAFDVKQEPAKVRDAYGDTAFGRACLAARRLTEVGVRCVEVTLDGWDSHAKNHEIQKARCETLDPSFAALIADLKERQLFERTIVICMGEFGRTPKINPLGGRDHWPNGFSVVLAGGGLKRGIVLGETDPEAKETPRDQVLVADIHATVLNALGIEYDRVVPSPIGRSVKLCEGKPIAALGGAS